MPYDPANAPRATEWLRELHRRGRESTMSKARYRLERALFQGYRLIRTEDGVVVGELEHHGRWPYEEYTLVGNWEPEPPFNLRGCEAHEALSAGCQLVGIDLDDIEAEADDDQYPPVDSILCSAREKQSCPPSAAIAAAYERGDRQ